MATCIAFRVEVSDLLKDCCTILGASVVLKQVAGLWDREVSVFFSTNGTGSDGVGTWQGVEACLYAIRSISKRVPSDESQVVPTVMDLIPRLPPRPEMWYVASRAAVLASAPALTCVCAPAPATTQAVGDRAGGPLCWLASQASHPRALAKLRARPFASRVAQRALTLPRLPLLPRLCSVPRFLRRWCGG